MQEEDCKSPTPSTKKDKSHSPEATLSHDMVHEGKYSKCKVQVIRRCLKMICNSRSLVAQTKANSQDDTISLHTCVAWLHSKMTDLQTRLQTNFLTYFAYFASHNNMACLNTCKHTHTPLHKWHTCISQTHIFKIYSFFLLSQFHELVIFTLSCDFVNLTF